MSNSEFLHYDFKASWHSLLMLKTILKRNGCRRVDEGVGDELWFSPLTHKQFSIASSSMTWARAKSKLVEAGISERG
jgi:hypothetical protein